MFHLGIDISKDSFSAHLILNHSNNAFLAKDFKSNKRGFNSLYAWLLKSNVILSKLNVVMEATGVYWQRLSHFLIDKHIRVAVVNPAQIKHFIKSHLRRGKTDSMDAGMIALYSLKMDTREHIVPDEQLLELKDLCKERDHLVKLRAKEKQRLHAHSYRMRISKDVLKMLNKRVKDFQKQILIIESLIKSVINGSEELSRVYNLLISNDGIAFVTAITMIAETDALAKFSNSKQLAAFAGIAPAPNQSGNFKGRSGISKIGNTRLRQALYMAALSAARTSTHYQAFKERLVAKNKPAKVILIAIARKILITAFAVVKSNKPFDPNYLRDSTPSSTYSPVVCS